MEGVPIWTNRFQVQQQRHGCEGEAVNTRVGHCRTGGEMRQDSDVDLLVEFLPEAEIGLLEHAGLMLDLSEMLGRKVDLVSKRALKPLIRDSIIREARPVYEA